MACILRPPFSAARSTAQDELLPIALGARKVRGVLMYGTSMLLNAVPEACVRRYVREGRICLALAEEWKRGE